MFTVASYITLIRLFLTPVVVYYIWLEAWLMAAAIFLLAAMTDLVDGYVARRFGQESDLGQILDPIADKFLIMATLYSLLLYVRIVPIGGADLIPYFLLLKEIVLLVGGGFLKWRYNFFIQPSRLSRAASLGEIFLILTLFVKGILPEVLYMSVEPGFERLSYAIWLEIICIPVVYINLFLSVWLLARYVYKVLKFKIR